MIVTFTVRGMYNTFKLTKTLFCFYFRYTRHDPELMTNLYKIMTRDYETAKKSHDKHKQAMSTTMLRLDRKDSLEALTQQKEIVNKCIYLTYS